VNDIKLKPCPFCGEKVENFNEDRWNECAAGIHFFITREEAIDY
jgi:hypothetical protein